MMFLVTQKHVVQKGAVRRQKLNCNFQRFTVPKFWLLLLLLKVERQKLLNLNFQLDNKPDLGTQAEVPYHKERYYLEECLSV